MKNEDFLKLISEMCSILMYYIEKLAFWSQFLLFCIEKWGMIISNKLFSENCCILMYFIDKLGFEVSSFVFIKKWGMRIS